MTYELLIEGTEHLLHVAAGEPLLDAALRANVLLPHDCRSGGCGTCRVRILEGSVRYPEGELPFGLDEAEAAEGYALACQAQPCSPLVIAAPEGLTAAQPARTWKATVATVHEVASGIYHLGVELDFEPAYLPGQYANILCDDGIGRSFSMASAPNGNLVDFHIRRIPGGRFTDQQLPRLQPGDTLDLELPVGGFRLHAEEYRPIVLIAAGTGIAPIKAMLQTLLDDPDCPPVALYWGMRTRDDLFLADEINSWVDRLYEFSFTPVLSRPGPGWTGRTGHVQQAVAQDLPDLSEHSVYICGSPEMVHDAKHTAIACGAPIEFIHAEGFSLQAHSASVLV